MSFGAAHPSNKFEASAAIPLPGYCLYIFVSPNRCHTEPRADQSFYFGFPLFNMVCAKEKLATRPRSPSLITCYANKNNPGIFILYFVVSRKFSVVLWTLGYLTFYLAIAFLSLPYAVWSDWFVNVLPSGGYGKTPLNLFSPAAPWNQSINGFTSRLFLRNEFSQTLFSSPVAARIVPYMISAVIVILTFTIIYKASDISKTDNVIDFEFSLLLATMYVVAPISWEHHLVFVLPAAIIALNLLLNSTESNVFQVIVVFSIFMLAWRFPHWADILKQGFLTLGISAKFYAVICIWIFYTLVILKHIKIFNRAQRSNNEIINRASSNGLSHRSG